MKCSEKLHSSGRGILMILRILLTLSVLLVSPMASAASPLEDQIAEAIEEKVREIISYPDVAEISVTNLRPSDKTLLRRAKKLLSVVLPPGQSGTRRVTAQVQVIPSGQRKVAFLWVVAQVDVRIPSVVASRAIARGTLITEEDLAIEMLSDPRSVMDTGLVVGRIPRRNFREGEVIRKSMIELPRVIKRGEDVTASVSGGGFSIKTSGTALDHGALGELISVRIVSTGKVVNARVTGPAHVAIIH
jgi:flagella basal body P-ring formation protein FlgA